jgi:choline dehydrogenase-like flavoprotein
VGNATFLRSVYTGFDPIPLYWTANLSTPLNASALSVVADVPGVGQNLFDQRLLVGSWNFSNAARVYPAGYQPSAFVVFLNASGVVAPGVLEPNEPNVELVFTPSIPSTNSTVSWSVSAYLGAHDVRWNLRTLTSSNPGAVIFLSGTVLPLSDLVNATLTRTWTYVRSLVQAPLSWTFVSSTVGGITTGNFLSATSATILAGTVTTANTYYRSSILRIAGSARMGLVSDPLAVVDTAFRVYGVQRLRVCDAAVLPRPFLQHGIEAEAALAAVCARKIVASRSEGSRRGPVCRRAPLTLEERSLGEFDFVVVGSGVSGSAVAGRLSETNATVLLLERGLAMPLYSILLQNFEHGTSQRSVTPAVAPERRGNLPASSSVGDTSFLPFTTNLGGLNAAAHGKLVTTASSSLDPSYGTFVAYGPPVHLRPDRKTLQLWESKYGITDWSWDDLFPYMKRWERFVDPEICGNSSLAGSVFGCNGTVIMCPAEIRPTILGSTYTHKTVLGGVRPNGNATDYIRRWLQRIGVEFSTDLTTGALGNVTNRGFARLEFLSNAPESWFPASFRQERASNLQILLDATASRIHWVADGPKQRAGFVELADGRLFKIRRDLVVTAGGLGSTPFLLNNGIGSETEMRAAGIRSIIPRTGHGRNFMDHIPAITTSLVACTNAHLDQRATPLWTTGSFRYRFKFSTIVGQRGSEIGEPNIQYTANIRVLSTAVGGTGNIQLESGYLQTKRRGTVSTVSGDPSYPGRLTDFYDCFEKDGAPNADDFDAFLAMYRMQQQLLFNSTIVLVPGNNASVCTVTVGTGEVPILSNLTATTEELTPSVLAFMEKNSFDNTIHYHGTARMGIESDPLAVVDNRCKVFGSSNVRIADTSIVPDFIHGHHITYAYTVAEKCAQHIKDDHGLSSVHPASTGPDAPPFPLTTPIVGLAVDDTPQNFQEEL